MGTSIDNLKSLLRSLGVDHSAIITVEIIMEKIQFPA